MNAQKFWEIIETSRSTCHDDDGAFVEIASDLISKLSESDIITFYRIQQYYHWRSETRKLWAAASIINGGASDDGFEYFRAHLLSFGRDAFVSAVNDPDSILEIDQRHPEFHIIKSGDCNDNESVMYICCMGYRKKFNLPNNDISFYDNLEIPLTRMSDDDARSLGCDILMKEKIIGIVDESQDKALCPVLWAHFVTDGN